MKQISSRLQEQQERLWLKGELWRHEHTYHQITRVGGGGGTTDTFLENVQPYVCNEG